MSKNSQLHLQTIPDLKKYSTFPPFRRVLCSQIVIVYAHDLQLGTINFVYGVCVYVRIDSGVD